MREMGQIIHNNPVGIDCPAYVDALLEYIRGSIATSYWNVNGEFWAGSDEADWTQKNYETGIPGIEWRPYYNWCGSPADKNWDQAKADLANFTFEGVEIRWYKRFGRSTNSNVEWGPEKWVRWFDRCIETISAFQSARRPFEKTVLLPDPKDTVPLAGVR